MGIAVADAQGGEPAFEDGFQSLLGEEADEFLRLSDFKRFFQVAEVAVGGDGALLHVGPVDGAGVGVGVVAVGAFSGHHNSVAGGLAGHVVDAAAAAVVFGRGHPHDVHVHKFAVGDYGLPAGGVCGFHIGGVGHSVLAGDHQQVDIGVGAVVAAGAGAEQDDGFGANGVVDGAGDGEGFGVVLEFAMGSHTRSPVSGWGGSGIR